MKRNTATQLLRLLTDEELRRLGKFLRSPYFNKSQPIVALFDCLRKWHPEYEEQRIRPHIFWKKIQPEKPFSEQKYWKFNFYLRCLIERFMAIEEMEGNETEFKKQLIKSHARRNAHALFEKETKTLVNKIKGQAHQDIHSYSESLWLKHDYFFNPLTDKYGGAIFSVENAMEDLDRFYLLAKLRFASEIKNRERIFSKKVPVHFLEESISASEKYEEENPAYLMYKIVLNLYVPEKAEAAFQKGKELMENKFPLMSKHDQNEVMLNLRNYAIRQLNKGVRGYWAELFVLFKLGLKLELIVNDDKITEATFGNIVKTGCFSGELSWTQNFVEKYEKYLDNSVRNDARVISLGIVFLYKKEYSRVVDIISQHEFTHNLHQMNGRVTLAKALFHQFLNDKELYESFLSKLEADEKYFRRIKSIAEQKKTAHINFILAVKKIADMIISGKSKSHLKNSMVKYLNEEKVMADKFWLKKEIEML